MRKPDRLSAPCSTNPQDAGSSRRHFISQLAALSAGLSVVTPIAHGAGETTKTERAPDQSPDESSLVDITLRVNGTTRKLRVDPRVTLLDALRERLDLVGTKECVGQGACGGCTVLLDWTPVVSGRTLAVVAEQK